MKREYVPSLIGKSGTKVAELRDKFKVRISFPRRQPPQPRAQPAAGDASATPQETATRQQPQQTAADTNGAADLPADTTGSTSAVPLTNGHSEHTTATVEAPAAAEAVPASAENEKEKENERPAAADEKPPENANEKENENERPAAADEKPPENAQPSAEEAPEKPAEAEAAPPTMSWADEMERTEARAAEEQLEEVVIVGYKDRADACRAEIERLVALAAAHTTEDLFVDASIHRHLIGALLQYTVVYYFVLH